MANILHVASGSIYAGLENQLQNTVINLNKYSNHQVQVLLFHEKLLAIRLKQRNIKVHIIPVDFLNYLTSLHAIRRVLLSERIDLVHTHGYKANITIHHSSIEIPNLKRVRSEHGLSEPFTGFKLFKYKFYEYYDRRIAKLYTDKVVAVSKDMYEYLTSFLPSEKIVYLRNSIGPAEKVSLEQLNSLREELKIGTNKKLIGTIGRFVPVKNYHLFIDLICELAQSDQNITGLMVGEGPLEGELKIYTERKNISDKIIFTGFREDIPAILGVLDLLVFTSRHEGLPMVLLEAMSQGTPIVAVGVGGLKEALRDCGKEVLVDSFSASELAQRCLRILNDPELRNKIVKTFKYKVKKDYSLESYINTLSRIYQDVLK